MRFREENPRELARARAAVAAWRSQNPGGTSEQLVADIGCRFHPDYGVVLRALMFAADRHNARDHGPGAPGFSGSRSCLLGFAAALRDHRFRTRGGVAHQ